MKAVLVVPGFLFLIILFPIGCADFDEYRDMYDIPFTTEPQYVYLDATAGGAGAPPDDPRNKYTYFNLVRGEVAELDDEEALESVD